MRLLLLHCAFMYLLAGAGATPAMAAATEPLRQRQHNVDSGPSSSSPPPSSPLSPRVAKWYKLDTGVCLNGDTPSLYASHTPADKNTSAGWVIEFGGPPGLNWCVSEAHCQAFGTPSKPGSSCGSGNSSLCPVNTTFLGIGGPFSTNCTDNPDFCGFNYARLDPSCTFDLFLGDSSYGNASAFNYTLHFDGQAVLASAITKLGTLGLANATQVLLTGVSWGGTAVFLNADRVHSLIRALNPGLSKFKALPVDGLHPKQSTVIYAGNNLNGPRIDSWLTGALRNLGEMANVTGALSPKCLAANPGAAWKCLYVNESLPFISSSLFAVNQMLSVWDSQCQIEGLVVPSILQVACSLKGPGWATARQCNQYPEYCTSNYIGNVTAPKQKQYIEDYENSGIHKQTKNGGFFHSCYLGSYFQSGWQGTAIWNLIHINGLTMRQAISNWWHDVDPQWTTDCVWDPEQLDEPPKWANSTCEDWKYDANHTAKTGCYEGGRSCCPPDNGGCRFFSCTPRPPWGCKWFCNPSCGKIQVYY